MRPKEILNFDGLCKRFSTMTGHKVVSESLLDVRSRLKVVKNRNLA